MQKRKFLALAVPLAIAGLFIGMVVVPAVQASLLVQMTAWDTADWQLDGGTTLGFPAIEGFTPPSTVRFQSVHEPVQEYQTMIGSSQAFSVQAYNYVQVVHQITEYSYYSTIEFYQKDSHNLFYDWHQYKVASVRYWAYQDGNWIGSGMIENPDSTEIMRLNAMPQYGQIKVYMQTEYVREDLAKGSKVYYVWP